MSLLIHFLLTAKRRWVQAISFVAMNSFFLQSITKAVPCFGMNCYACPAAIFACPIGTLQHFAIIRQVPLYTLGLLGVVGALVGRLACGWLCPFGWLQELLYGLRKRLRWPEWRLSNRLGWLRYAFLVLLVGIVPFVTLEPWFSKLCPVGTLEAGIPLVATNADLRALVGPLFFVKVLILVGFLAWMTATKRPFCRFVCPLGAIWSPFNRASTLKLSIDRHACTDCDVCRSVCPVDISVHEDPASTRCVRCMECVRSCPESAIRVSGE